MRVLFLTRLYWPHVGGVEKHIQKLSQELIVRGYDITVVAEAHNPSLPEREVKDGVEIYRIPLPETVGERQKKWLIWKWWLGHLRLIKQADIIHIHDVFFWFLPFRLPFRHKKVFMTFHGYEGADAPNRLQVFWHRLAAKLTLGNICIGDFHSTWYGVKPDFVSYGAA